MAHHSNGNSDKRGQQQQQQQRQQHGKKQRYRDSLEGQDFVNKVSRFEYMTHGGGNQGNNQAKSPERTKVQVRSKSDERSPRSPRSPPGTSPNRSQTTFTLTAVPRSPTLARKAVIKTSQPGSSVTVTQLDENITILNSRTIKTPDSINSRKRAEQVNHTPDSSSRKKAEQVNHTPPSGHQSRSKEVKRSPFLSRRTPSKSKSPKRNQSPKTPGGENSDTVSNNNNNNKQGGGVFQSIKNALKSPKLGRRSISKSPVRRKGNNSSDNTENNNNSKIDPVPKDSEKSSCSPLLSRRKVSKSPNRKDPNAKPPAGNPKSIVQRSPKLSRKSGSQQQQQQQQQQQPPSSPKPHRVQFTSPSGARPSSGSYKSSSSSSGKSSPTDPLKRNSYPHTPSSPQNSFQSEAFSVKVTPQSSGSQGEGQSSDQSRSPGGHAERTRSASPPGCFSLSSESSPSAASPTSPPSSAGVLKSSKTINLSFKFPSPSSFGANSKDLDNSGSNISILRGPQSPDSVKGP